jgi:hypothetical protein
VGSYSHTFAAALQALLPPAPAAATQQEQQQSEQQQQNGHVSSSSSAQQSEALAGGGLSQLLLMAHHPAITAGVSKKLGAWQAACNRMTGIAAELKGVCGGKGGGQQHAQDRGHTSTSAEACCFCTQQCFITATSYTGFHC